MMTTYSERGNCGEVAGLDKIQGSFPGFETPNRGFSTNCIFSGMIFEVCRKNINI